MVSSLMGLKCRSGQINVHPLTIYDYLPKITKQICIENPEANKQETNINSEKCNVMLCRFQYTSKNTEAAIHRYSPE